MIDTLMSRFFSGTIITGLGKIAVSGFGLIGIVIVTRTMSAEAFGVFVLVRVSALFLAQVSGMGMEIALPHFIAGSEDDGYRRRLTNTSIYFRLGVIALTSVLAVIFSAQIASIMGASAMSEFMMLLPVIFFLESLTRLLQTIHQGFFDFKCIGLSDVVASSTNFGLLVLAVVVFEQGLPGLFFARIVSRVFGIVLLYFSLPIRRQLEFDRAALLPVLKFGFPLQFNDLLTFIFMRLDTFIINAMLGTAGVGLYEIARRIPDNLYVLYQAFQTVYFPSASQLYAAGERRAASRLLNNSTRIVSFATSSGALVAVLFGEGIITTLFSTDYAESVPAFIWLMIALNISLVGYTLGSTVVAVGDSDKPVITNIFHTISAVATNLTLIPVFGLAGAAMATVVGSTVTNPLNVYFLRRRKIDVTVMAYAKPILIFIACALYGVAFGSLGVAYRLLVLVVFVMLNVMFDVIKMTDISVVLGEAKPLVARALRR